MADSQGTVDSAASSDGSEGATIAIDAADTSVQDVERETLAPEDAAEPGAEDVDSGTLAIDDAGAGSDAASIDAAADAASQDIGPPSCQTMGLGTSQCGPSGESCCTSLEVSGGTYYRTYANGDGGATGMADPATVSSFRLDKYLVTVGRYARFVAAWNAGWAPSSGSGKHVDLNGGEGLTNCADPGSYEPGWQTTDNISVAPTDANLNCQMGYGTWGNAADLPINCVNWYEAYAFCIWDGGFLPSEAEWEYAAAGGSLQLPYPWGSTPPGTSNQYSIYGCYYPSISTRCSSVAAIAPVGTATLGAGFWGHLDLAGDLWEWNLDGYGGAYLNPSVDCSYPKVAGNVRVARGGSFDSIALNLAPAKRSSVSPDGRSFDFGFRCARTP